MVTLFHEFGHILHQTLTRARFTRFSGTRVERDFVEAPSQMLEHWCWERDVLAGFSRHWQTGDPLPDDLIDRLIAAKYVSSGIATLRQVYFARLDLAYHGPGASKDTDAIARELHPITGFAFPPDTHFQAGFGHLFGYDAGYYGYLWSRVYGDDMFTRFEGSAASPESVGHEYRSAILERGGAPRWRAASPQLPRPRPLPRSLPPRPGPGDLTRGNAAVGPSPPRRGENGECLRVRARGRVLRRSPCGDLRVISISPLPPLCGGRCRRQRGGSGRALTR